MADMCAATIAIDHACHSINVQKKGLSPVTVNNLMIDKKISQKKTRQAA